MMAADGTVRHDWTIDQITALHELPLLELVGRANAVHRQHHDPNKVQKARLDGACNSEFVLLRLQPSTQHNKRHQRRQ